MSFHTKVAEFYAHQENVNCVTFGFDSPQVYASGADDNNIHVWKIGTASPIQTLGHTNPVDSVRFSRDDCYVAGGSRGGSLKLWDLQAGKLKSSLSGHRASVRAIDFHPYGDLFITGSLDTYIKAFDLRNKNCVNTFKAHTAAITAVRHSPDGRWIVSADEVGQVKVWDLTAGKLVQEFKNIRREPVRAVDFHPSEYILACGDGEKAVNFWDMEKFELIATTTRETSISAITFNNGGDVLMAGCQDTLKTFTWDPQVVRHDTKEIGWGTVSEMTCVEDEELYAIGFSGTVVKVWSVDLTRCAPFHGVDDAQSDVHVSPQKSPHSLRAHMYTPQTSTTPNPKSRGTARMEPALADVAKMRSPRFQSNSARKPAGERKAVSSFGFEIKSMTAKSVMSGESSPGRSPSKQNQGLTSGLVGTLSAATAPAGSVPAGLQPALRLAPASSAQSYSQPPAVGDPAPGMNPGEGDWVFQRSDRLSRHDVVPSGQPSSASELVAGVRSKEYSPIIAFATLRQQVDSRRLKNGFRQVSSAPAAVKNTGKPAQVSGLSGVVKPAGLRVGEGAVPIPRENTELVMGTAEKAFFDSDTAPLVRPGGVSAGERTHSAGTAHGMGVLHIAPSTAPVPSATLGSHPKFESNTSATDSASAPLNLSPSAFLAAAPYEPVEIDLEALRVQLLSDHRTMVSILTTRVAQLRVLGALWQQGNVRRLVDTLLKMNEQAVAVDFLAAAEEVLTSSQLTLELAHELLPLLRKLLDSRFQIYVQTSLRYLIAILRAFTPLLRDTRANPAGGLMARDLAREERLTRCQNILDVCAQILHALPGVLSRHQAIAESANDVQLLLEALLRD